MKKLLVLLLAGVMAFASSACSLEENIFIVSQNSPDRKYTVCLYQVGSPQWSFGSVKAKLMLKDNDGNTIDEETFSLANDGGGVFASNIKEIIWSEAQVDIIMGECDTTKQFTYRLHYGE